MRIPLSDVLTMEGRTEQKRLLPELTSVSWQGQTYRVLEKDDIVLTLSNVEKGKARIEGEARLTLLLFCDRCLEEVRVPFVLPLARTVTEEDGWELDAEELLHEELMLNWPVRVLCREDCKGLCSVCGKNLNAGSCGCDPFVPDPRMANIQEIFKRNKEV